MKKKNLKNIKSLKLNKRAISQLDGENLKGGTLGIICTALSLALTCIGDCTGPRTNCTQ